MPAIYQENCAKSVNDLPSTFIRLRKFSWAKKEGQKKNGKTESENCGAQETT